MALSGSTLDTAYNPSGHPSSHGAELTTRLFWSDLLATTMAHILTSGEASVYAKS